MNHLPTAPRLMDHRGRLRRLQAALAENKLDFLLITHLPDVRYLTGFTGSSAALLVGDHSRDHGRDQGATLFTDGRYIAQAKQEVKSARTVIDRQAPVLAAADWLTKDWLMRHRRRASPSLPVIGIQGESMTAGARDRLAARLRGKAKLRVAPPLVEPARMIKDAAELQLIRSAVRLGAGLFRVALRKIRPGVPEVAVAAAMEYEARRNGAEEMSFPTILAAGARSAMVHARASNAPIPATGFVVCDFGVILAGYCSDRTRTVHVGRPSRAARDLYAAVEEAQQAAIAVVKPGITAAAVDEAARHVLRKRKLARWFTHSTGHGVGLEIHEAPRVAAGQAQVLEPGMVITIEPGAYLPGKGGVRIEDMVVVTPTGCEVLGSTDERHADKDLIVI